MRYEKIITLLMCFSRNTFFVWKREKRPIIALLEKYHSKEELEEFLETGKISKQDRLNELLQIEQNYKELKTLFDKHSQ